MKSTAAALTACLLLVTLQATINTVTTTPAPIQCSDGEYVESEGLCNSTITEQPSRCRGDLCKNSTRNDSDDAVDVGAEDRCANCSKGLLTVQEAFNQANFVVRGTVVRTSLTGVNYVTVETMVQLVMKSSVMITPGKLLLTVRLNQDWMCGCPGVDDLRIGETYLITGFEKHTKRKSNGSKYELRVNHHSIVEPWSETIIEDIMKTKKHYHGLKFVPSLNVYRAYLAYFNYNM